MYILCYCDLQLEFFTSFKLKHQDVLVMLTKFQSLKPWFVKRLKEWNMCTCQYHTKLNELRLGLNALWVGKHVHDSYCACSCEGICRLETNTMFNELSCFACFQTYNTLISLWSSLLCSKEQNDEFHKRSYIMGDYLLCGIKFLNVCLKELSISTKIEWHNINYEVVGKTSNFQDKKVSKVMYNGTKPFELIKYLKPHLSEFIVHNFIAHW